MKELYDVENVLNQVGFLMGGAKRRLQVEGFYMVVSPLSPSFWMPTLRRLEYKSKKFWTSLLPPSLKPMVMISKLPQ